MKAHIKTYGCQMNEQDSLHMKGLLSNMGYDTSDSPLDADLILLVGCSIREKAVHKVYSDLGRVRPVTEINPNVIVGVAGCVAQQEKGNLFKRYPFIDMVFGPDAIRKLPDMVSEVLAKKKDGARPAVLHTHFDPRRDFEFVNLVMKDEEESRVKAFVNIQKGCDNICSFCIVPQVRGREVSRPSDDIIKEVGSLVEMGVKEVTLLGQNVNSYGLKVEGELRFPDLLRRIASETDLKRLRFITSHPKDVDDDLIRAYRDLDILCPHLHLPVQSGSNRVLEAMRRQYTREHYLQIIQKLREAKPGIIFTSDIIVGFPGEEARDFEETLDLIGQVRFDLIYAYTYSQRPGTTASRETDQLSHEEKNQRLEVLMTRQRQISTENSAKLQGTVQEVLVEKASDKPGSATWFGRTDTNKIVHLTASNNDLTAQIVKVRITETHPHSLNGEVLI